MSTIATYPLPEGATYGPEITSLSPASLTVLESDTPISLTVSSAYDITLLQIVAVVDGQRELIYDNLVFGLSPDYSITSVDDTPPTSFVVTGIRRQDGWQGAVAISVTAVDEDGGLLAITAATYTSEGVSEGAAPALGNFAPTNGTPIVRGGAISFDVVHPAGASQLRLVVIGVSYADGDDERVWNGTGFTPYYVAGSSRQVIPFGHRYTIRRRGGWPYTPSVYLEAVDRDGQLATEL